ncbi:MAG: HMA2 domain-containing protein [Coleofasciculus sp.]|uniref:HMA2 domain-containing protein n=1 Tax=Coleofasciculus sp. TaxID=3100458 RepID=UPI003A280A57
MVGVVSPRPEREVEILHVVPGRLRLRVLGEEPGTVLRAVTPRLRKRVGVREIRTNEQIGSLLITFDTNQLSLAQLFKMLGDLGIAEIKQPQSKEPLDAEAWKKAGTQLQSFIPLLIGLLTTRQLGIQGWRSIPVYLLITNVVRQIMQSWDLAEGESEGTAEGRSMLSNNVKGQRAEAQKQGGKAERNNADLNGDNIPNVTPDQQNGNQSTVALNANSTVVYGLVHAVPGRMRFRVPKVAEDSAYLRRLQSLVKKDDWITQMRCNSTVASVVITYNPMQVGEAEAGLHFISLIQIAANPDSKEPGSRGAENVETCHGTSAGTSAGTSGNPVVGAGFTDNVRETTDNLTKPALPDEPEEGSEEIAAEPDLSPPETSSAEPNSLTPPVQVEQEDHKSEEAGESSVDQDVQPANTNDSVADQPEPMEDTQAAIATSVSPWLDFKSAALSTLLRLMAKMPIVGV